APTGLVVFADFFDDRNYGGSQPAGDEGAPFNIDVGCQGAIVSRPRGDRLIAGDARQFSAWDRHPAPAAAVERSEAASF
ncbi:hypothetical protein, partial [Pseudomonas fluorescens]|uniref:hypothetical protein n=1 Tax=Pseudomonas fluorescens TaxID=294 RepID=UPI001CD499CE